MTDALVLACNTQVGKPNPGCALTKGDVAEVEGRYIKVEGWPDDTASVWTKDRQRALVG